METKPPAIARQAAEALALRRAAADDPGLTTQADLATEAALARVVESGRLMARAAPSYALAVLWEEADAAKARALVARAAGDGNAARLAEGEAAACERAAKRLEEEVRG